MQADREPTARRIQDAIRQEVAIFVRTLTAQLSLVGRLSGVSLREASLVPSSTAG
jgi:hypothetical protein